MRFDGKVVIVTGAGQGIGRAIAHRFGAEGARVVIGELNQDSGERVAQEIVAAGGQAIAVRTDVRDPASVSALMEHTVQHYGGLDVLVNNAGLTSMSGVQSVRFDEMEPSEWERIISTNLTGVWLVSRAASPHLRARPGSSIVNFASVHSYAINILTPHYDAAKAAVVSLTRNLAVALAAEGVRVNGIAPGPIRTEVMEAVISQEMKDHFERMTPMKRSGSPDEIASVVAFLASDDASYVTGVTIPVDGGFLADHWGQR